VVLSNTYSNNDWRIEEQYETPVIMVGVRSRESNPRHFEYEGVGTKLSAMTFVVSYFAGCRCIDNKLILVSVVGLFTVFDAMWSFGHMMERKGRRAYLIIVIVWLSRNKARFNIC
jgi:hypothetical protein